MSYEEPNLPIEPPEIREVQEQYRIVEFWVDLGDSRPDLQLLDMVKAWLAQQPPLTIGGLLVSYHKPSDVDEPALLEGILLVGAPLDLG